MRTINIDFTKSPVEISDMELGHQGEHNATELTVIPPTEMSQNSKIVSYSIAFQIGAHLKCHSKIVSKSDVISVEIPREVTELNITSIQVEGYDGEEGLLVKSDRVDNLIFKGSITGKEYEGNTTPQLVEQVAYLKNKIENGSGDSAVQTLEFNVGDVYVDSGEDVGSNGDVSYIIAMSESDSTLPEGAKIKDIRFKGFSDHGDVSMKNLTKYDLSPYVLNMEEVTHHEERGAKILAVIYTFGYTHPIIEEIKNYSASKVEIDYCID